MMSEDTRNWRPLLSSATNKLNSFKGYIASKDPRPLTPAPPSTSSQPSGRDPSCLDVDPGSGTRQSWAQWAGEKLRRGGQPQGNGNAVEKVSLFPGWAARRLHKPSPGEDTHFDTEVYVAGFASRLNNPECMSRSQRAFLRLAKGFAALPKLQDEIQPGQLPPPPSEMTEAQEIQFLEEHFRKLNNNPDAPESASSSTSATPLRRSPSISSQSSSSDIRPVERIPSVASSIQELHANLERRLMPFWSSALSNRTVRISLYVSEDVIEVVQALGNDAYDCDDPRLLPVASRKVTTAQDGSFQIKFGIPWDVLLKHPDGSQIAFGDITKEYDLFVLAELLPPPPPPPTVAAPYPAPTSDTPVSMAQIKVPLSYTPVRVISDIDDTVKAANVLSGARVVFYTVFVQSLADIVIPGMGDWYTKMWQRGARFHYVSNGPFEILPVLNEFFPLAGLPPGSIRLRSYAGRSLFNGFLSAPAARKRQGVIDTLNNFPESQFILIGDSGEQDMELYATVAMERPQQVLAVFIRDARTPLNGERPQPVEDPTGATTYTRWKKNYNQRSDSTGSTRSVRQTPPGAFDNMTITQPTMSPGPTPNYQNRQHGGRQNSADYFNRSGRSSSSPNNTNDSGPAPWLNDMQIQEEPTTGEIDTSMGLGPRPAGTSDAEWKRLQLQMRVDRARVNMPQSVRFRLFVDPEECVEAFEVLDSNKRDIKPDLNVTIRAGQTPPTDPQPDSEGILVDI